VRGDRCREEAASAKQDGTKGKLDRLGAEIDAGREWGMPSASSTGGKLWKGEKAKVITQAFAKNNREQIWAKTNLYPVKGDFPFRGKKDGVVGGKPMGKSFINRKKAREESSTSSA